jgi:hypothetical protein
VGIGSGEHYAERDAASVEHNMALRARFSLIRRILAGSCSPLFAGMLAESKEGLFPNLSLVGFSEAVQKNFVQAPPHPSLLPFA